MEFITSLEQFNSMLGDYMHTYNTTFHRGIDDTPMNRYLHYEYNLKKTKSSEWLDECFLNRITCNVRKDSTVLIDKDQL